MVLIRETLCGIAAFCRDDAYPFISHGHLGGDVFGFGVRAQGKLLVCG
jgi:hypothetical protein